MEQRRRGARPSEEHRLESVFFFSIEVTNQSLCSINRFYQLRKIT
jgi:hypothetical protein